MIEVPNQKGASFSPTDGSLPSLGVHPRLAGKTEVKFSSWLQFLSSLCGFRLGGVTRRARSPGFLNPKQSQRGKRIETAGEVFNPKVPQGAKRIETAGKIFNPKVPQKSKRIEVAAEDFNPNRL